MKYKVSVVKTEKINGYIIVEANNPEEASETATYELENETENFIEMDIDEPEIEIVSIEEDEEVEE